MNEFDRPSACLACFSPLPDPAPDECPECGAPVSRTSSFDHVEIIRTQGEMFRRGARNPSAIVVIGMWLLFAPTMIAFILLGFSTRPASLLTSSPFVLLYGAILWKVTMRYRAARREAARDELARRYEEPCDHWSDV